MRGRCGEPVSWVGAAAGAPAPVAPAAFPWTASSVCAAVTGCFSDGGQSERWALLCARSARLLLSGRQCVCLAVSADLWRRGLPCLFSSPCERKCEGFHVLEFVYHLTLRSRSFLGILSSAGSEWVSTGDTRRLGNSTQLSCGEKPFIFHPY